MTATADNLSLIDRYLDMLTHQRQLSGHTVSSYRRDLSALNALTDGQALASLTQANIRKCAAQLHAKGLNPRSIARTLSSWRGFFNWLADSAALSCNPVDGIRPPRKGKPLPKALSADDAIHLVAHGNPARGDSTMQTCNRAMFELLYSSGLRISELCGLDWQYTKDASYISSGWLDVENREVLVTGKGNKMRAVPVGGPALAAITEWLAVRASMPPSADIRHQHALFLTERGTRMSARVAQLRLKEHSKGLSMATDVHPHMLRHSFASHMLQGSGDLRAVQELLGHSSIAATQIYTSLDFQRLAQVYDAAHPRAKKSDDTA